MFIVVAHALKQWNRLNDRHTKLQHMYAITAIVTLITAGLISLLNYNLGQTLLSIAYALAAVFFVNAVAWALADSFIISRLNRRSSKR